MFSTECLSRLSHQPVAPQMLGAPTPPQVCPSGQVPHSITPPQPSPAAPQSKPSDWHVAGVQGTVPEPHTLGPPAPQVWPLVHIPQSMRLPQPSPVLPQL